MPYQLEEKDFDFFMPDANQVLAEQVLMLAHNILPGSKGWAGFQAQYFHPDDEVTLYLDERENDTHLFIGGCLVASNEAKDILPELASFKSKFRPENDPMTWFLKGSGMHVGVDADVEDEENARQDALSRWVLWARFLASFGCYYRFHSVSVNKQKFVHSETARKKKNVERYRRAYESLFKTLEQNRHSKITVVTDNVEGAQLAGLQEAIDNSDNILERKITLSPPVPKEDFTSVASSWLQFVDMQIYALSRFIFPSGENVLMKFEKYPYDSARGDVEMSKDPVVINQQRFEVARYFILKDIFHHIRRHFVVRLVSPHYETSISSMACITDKEILNFADLVDKSIHGFCNRQFSEITFDFEAL
ncbi:DUF3800 domain-containing protein [Vibrio parahaemolyticus]|uniref:DUF3800 domain-containing protein n=1 Tax=Vibrio parahaemolyticus TaxID=670 RepID=UPI0004A35881|nr:DUF3800 domain-containing protein [Vibrio parahaemolyticus]EGQ8922737.1 DUF3800 domain-containing protein [Vibrio parahaemolyticus]EGR2856884.1 DUF3800 domain-containing protein [Vibrio parahaemolyticus]EGR2945923.1 DUF3800 domain-containing protein [Vibrio parahaemolyticus]EGR3064769.1 DUF3800 domain-containing protein [Vibrio parahaemolyticus]EGR3140810.1 DUF3800 domain-containing protein [Vibrio parahaemolyticus]